MIHAKRFSRVGAALAALFITASMAAWSQGGATILKPAEMTKLMPASVFYRGQSASTQLRNSGGIKFQDGYFVLSTLVDTSGYSTGVAARYQAYFITEVPIKIEGKHLAAGAYGIGFIDGDKMAVTDLGAHDVFVVSSSTDSAQKRPMPLQVTADDKGGFRLYVGRRYVTLTR
jgi:hypothetical protein